MAGTVSWKRIPPEHLFALTGDTIDRAPRERRHRPVVTGIRDQSPRRRRNPQTGSSFTIHQGPYDLLPPKQTIARYIRQRAQYCRSRKKPRERRFELRNMLFWRCGPFRILAFYEGINIDFPVAFVDFVDLRG